jgi:hypothetical protein
MLLVYGVATLAVGAVLIAAAGHLFETSASSPLQRFLGSETFDVLLASLMGMGLVMLFIFIIGDKTQSPVLLETLLAGAVAAAGYVGVRLVGRMADRRKRAA